MRRLSDPGAGFTVSFNSCTESCPAHGIGVASMSVTLALWLGLRAATNEMPTRTRGARTRPYSHEASHLNFLLTK